LVKCYKCGWEGKEEEQIKELGNLMFYDQVLMNSLKGVRVTRSNLLCPKCGELLKSQRQIDTIADEE